MNLQVNKEYQLGVGVDRCVGKYLGATGSPVGQHAFVIKEEYEGGVASYEIGYYKDSEISNIPEKISKTYSLIYNHTLSDFYLANPSRELRDAEKLAKVFKLEYDITENTVTLG